jgi:protein-disulfide isomerase
MPTNDEAEVAKNFGLSLSIAASLIAFGGLFAAAVLSAGHILKLPVPCGSSSGCIAVASDPRSRFAGVPIAFFGVAAYIAILFLLMYLDRARWARFTLVVLAIVGTILSVRLLFYAHFVIHATCYWCVASAVAMTILCMLAICLWRAKRCPRSVPAFFLWRVAGITLFAIGAVVWLMERRAAAAPIAPEKLSAVTVDELLGGGKSRGPADAPVKIIIFSDLWCSVCRAVHGPLMDYQSAHPNDVQVIFRHRPLYGIAGHETSETAAILSEIAAEQGKFWRFVDRLYREPHQLDQEGYLGLMRELGFESPEAQSLIADPHSAPALRVERDRALADRLGVHLTPTFVVIIDHKAPVSANHRSLTKILNSSEVEKILGEVGKPTGLAK